MTLTTIAMLNLALTACTAHYGTGTTALTWFRGQCVDHTYACLVKPDADAVACVKAADAKICDPSGENCY